MTDKTITDRERLDEIDAALSSGGRGLDFRGLVAAIEFLRPLARIAIEAAAAPSEVAAAINAMWPIKNGTVADMARAGVAAATAWRKAHEPKPSEIDVEAVAKALRREIDEIPLLEVPQIGKSKVLAEAAIAALDAHRRARGEDVEAMKAQVYNLTGELQRQSERFGREFEAMRDRAEKAEARVAHLEAGLNDLVHCQSHLSRAMIREAAYNLLISEPSPTSPYGSGDDPVKDAIEAMADAIATHMMPERVWPHDLDEYLLSQYRECAARAFHAQNGLVRVVPIKATDEMAEAANSLYEDEVYASSIDEANKVGDLTKPKE